MKARLAAMTLALVLAASVASGCSASPEPAEPTPVFTTEEEAFAAAEETYRAYVDALNQVDLSDPETFEDVFAWTTGDANAGERKSLAGMHANGWSVQGETVIESVTADRFDPASENIVELLSCTDVHTVQVLDASGESVVDANRPVTQSSRISFEWEPASPTGMRISQIDGGDLSCTG